MAVGVSLRGAVSAPAGVAAYGYCAQASAELNGWDGDFVGESAERALLRAP